MWDQNVGTENATTTSLQSFVHDTAVVPSELLQPLLSIVDDVLLCIRITNGIVRGTSSGLHNSYLADARMWTQWQILTLPTCFELESSKQYAANQLRIYEAIRICLRIFGLIGVFPLPPSTAPFAELAETLASSVGIHMLDNSVGLLRLWMWVSTLGALAAGLATPRRAFFVGLARQIAHLLQLNSWADMKKVLQSFLWYPEVSDFDGHYLWREMQGNQAGTMP
jgi:hypothetical protein